MLLATSFVAVSALQGQGPPPVLDTVLAARCGAECDVVTGTVYDSLGKTPLAAALVVASPSGVMIATDSLGHFQLVSDQRIDRLTVYHDVLEHTGLGALALSRPEGCNPLAERAARHTRDGHALAAVVRQQAPHQCARDGAHGHRAVA